MLQFSMPFILKPFWEGRWKSWELFVIQCKQPDFWSSQTLVASFQKEKENIEIFLFGRVFQGYL